MNWGRDKNKKHKEEGKRPNATSNIFTEMSVIFIYAYFKYYPQKCLSYFFYSTASSAVGHDQKNGGWVSGILLWPIALPADLSVMHTLINIIYHKTIRFG